MTRHSLLWLLAIISIFLFAPLVVTTSDYEECIRSEMSESLEWYGDDEATAILQRTNRIYSAIMVRSGLDPAIRKHFVKPKPSTEIAPGVEMPKTLTPYANHLMDYWANLLTNIWLFCLRLAHSASWIIYLTPFLAATIFDGIMRRKAKLASFQYTSPTVYNLSWHVIIALVACSVVTFAVSMPLSVFVYPVVLTVVGMFVRLVISNIQHSA